MGRARFDGRESSGRLPGLISSTGKRADAPILNRFAITGASMIVESLAKYSELLVIERMRGRVRQLLEIELDRPPSRV